MTVRNVRNNNPGNIRLSGTQWNGSIPGSDTSFVTFATPEAGVRAMTRNLYTYQSRYGLSTVGEMINRWAPPNENNTSAYASSVASSMGVGVNDPINLRDNPQLTERMVLAMINEEGGPESVNYFNSHIAGGVRDANDDTVQYSIPPGEAGYAPGQVDPKLNVAASTTMQDGVTASVEDLAGLVDKNNWENNVLEIFDDYSYNIELFLVGTEDTRRFFDSVTLGDITSGSWPSSETKKIIVASTGLTTEFNLIDLNIRSSVVGSDPNIIAGAAINLDFTLVQIGKVTMADTLKLSSQIAGWTNLSQAVFFVKITFKGYDQNGNVVDAPNTTKVIPFRMTSFTDINSVVDARGNSIRMTGAVIRASGMTAGNDRFEDNIEFDIGTTLGDTLNNLIEKVNEYVQKSSYSVDSRFMKTYSIDTYGDFNQTSQPITSVTCKV